MSRIYLLLLLSICSPAAEPVAPRSRIELFNGKDLANFYVSLKESGREDPKGVFSVTGGLIRISGEEWGALTTRDAYTNYRLVVEWKWGEKTWPPRVDRARDSGILLHGVGDDGAAGNGWLESIEYQIIEGGTGDLILVKGATRPRVTVEARTGPDGQLYWQKGAARATRDSGRINWFARDVNWQDRLGVRGPRDLERPRGEWNRSEITAAGPTLTYYLNGQMVNQAFDSSHTGGKIQIQSEAAEIFIRNIEIEPSGKR